MKYTLFWARPDKQGTVEMGEYPSRQAAETAIPEARAELMAQWQQNDETDARIEAGDWIIDCEEVMLPNGKLAAMDAARALMDDDLCDRIHGTVDSEQAFLDRYVELHQEKYGVPFTVS